MAQVIGGRYTIVSEIGVGGMGRVYLGTDRQSNQQVAIKQLKSDLNEPEILERFRREGEALRDLNHPNIVHMLDAVEQDGQQYLVMEYLPGGDLNQLLRQGQLPIKRVLEIAIDLADALTRAHRLNIVHRDLKPANVLLAADGTPRLTDFGVAYIAQKERVTGTGAAVGTLDYLSPEALGGEGVDARADIWAFGVMLFEMVAGQRPFYRPIISEVIGAIMIAPVPDLEEMRPECPVGLVDLIYRMLEKDPGARIPSIRLVGAELEAILQGRESPERFHTPVSVELPAHNLPPQLTGFVGREKEVTTLVQRLNQGNIRLVTILAPGGMGKTRLALEVARQQVEHFEDGAYLVALAPLTSPDFIVSATAEALGFQFFAGGEPKQQLLDYLRDKTLLLVMDNFEHVLDGAGMVADILAYAPRVKVLATSRERLNLSSEVTFSLGPLGIPEAADDTVANFDALKLFWQHSRADDADMESEVAICRMVAGMPLGIVLAAAWTQELTLAEIAREIEQNLDFLETEMRDVPERHRSIRAVFEYAWNRLSDDERDVFKKLSVFRGGFTREAAQVVAGASLKTLLTLVNKALIHRDAETGRYAFHELLRQYAEKQVASADALAEAHLRYFADFMTQRTADVKGRRQLPALDEIEADFANVRAAWEYAVSTGDYRTLDQMCECLSLYCEMRGRMKEVGNLFENAARALESLTDETGRRVWGHLLAYYGGALSDDTFGGSDLLKIEQTLDTSLTIARQYHETAVEAFCLLKKGAALAFAFKADTRKEGVACLEAALPLYQSLNDTYYTPTLIKLIIFGRGDWDAPDFQRILDMQRQQGNKHGLAWSLVDFHWHQLALAHPIAAELCTLEAQVIMREIRDMKAIVGTLEFQSCAVFYRGEFDRAEQLMRDIMRDMAVRALPLNNLGWIGSSLARQAVIRMVRDSDYEGGKQLSGEVLRLYNEKSTLHFLVGESNFSLTIAAYAEGDYASARHIFNQTLRTMPTWQIPILCLSILFRAQDGRHEEAAELLALLDAQAEVLDSWKDGWGLMKHARLQLEKTLSPDSYSAARERGEARDWKTTLQALMTETEP